MFHTEKTATKTTLSAGRQNLLYRLKAYAVSLWHKAIMIGVDDVEVKRDKKRIRLLNGICIMAIGVLAIYFIMYSAPRYRLTFWESFVGLVAYGIVLFLNYQKKYNSASLSKNHRTRAC